MESISLRENEKRASESSKKWDVYDEDALEFDDSNDGKTLFTELVKLLKIVVYLATFVIVLSCATLSKASLLLMTSAIGRNRTFPICRNLTDGENGDRYDGYEAQLSARERQSWIWCLFIALLVPEVLTFIRCSRLCIFKKYEKPNISSFITVSIIESLYVVGIVILVFGVFPQIHIMKSLSLCNAICFVPSVLNLYSTLKSHGPSRKVLRIILNSSAFLFQATTIIYFIVSSLKYSSRQEITVEILAFVSVLLISFSWWENFISQDYPRCFIKSKEDIEKSRNFIYVFVSLWKVCLMSGLIVVFLILTSEDLESFFDIDFIFKDYNVSMVWPEKNGLTIPPTLKPREEINILNFESNFLLPVAVAVIHISATFACYTCCKFVCKVWMQQFSFAMPLCLVVPATMNILNLACMSKSQTACAFTSVSPYIFWFCPSHQWSYIFDKEFGFIWVFWVISQVFITGHIWDPKCERMASTNKLFVNPMYSTVLVDQSLVLNRRKYEKEISEAVETIADEVIEDTSDHVTRIFACATMWHETSEEMEQLLKSIMRMDVHQCSQATIQDGFLIRNPDYYELQVHIFFDDAFVISDEDDEKRTINSFVKDFIIAVDTAASKVYKKCSRPDPPMKVPTPYGGQLVWRLLGDNFLILHLKDKELIRHKKRWSQVMYMYYLLGYGLEHKLSESLSDESAKENLRRNTFVLALDGDIDFQPSAVQLLVDLMKRNENLGAACGRIHPVGTGLMVYYQKFEYAIGHWLQKSTEHMIGCVLCSPGCFSLFRAEALLKKNTIRTYANIAKEAIEYVQFDQGEDRWLCTLLLQRGYRVEYSAASDAYTHCPETFAEFYTQRRRWAPSTMANIMDLLVNYQKTVECNDNISRLYIAYQVLLMVGTILGPGTIFLMLVGAMVSAFGISNWQALLVNFVPILFFIIICFQTKNDTQIFIAQIFSALYALLMMAVLVGISLQLVVDGITSPSGIFILTMTASFVIAALVHPQEFWCVAHGIIYFLSVPSMYLLLALYSFVNLNVVSWGTREVQTKKSKKQIEAERLQVVQQPTKGKSGMFDWMNTLGFREGQPEEEGSLSFSFANLFRCMFCTYPKPDPSRLQMVKIEMALEQMNSQMKTLQYQMDSTLQRKPALRRKSSIHLLNKDLNLETVAEEDESDEMDDSSLEQPSEQEEHMYNQVDNDAEYWLSDPTLKKSAIKRLTNQESEFWRELIDTYLYPLADNPGEKAKVSRQLKELRNKVVFGVLMMNALFILIVFLLQMKKDILFIEWPLNGKNRNITYIYSLNEIRIEMEYLQLEPINLVLVFFFTLILVIQFIGMLFHRSETLSHILATTNLFAHQAKTSEEINFSKLTDLLRKQGLESDDGIDCDEALEEEDPSREPTIVSSLKENGMKKKFRSLSLAMEHELLKIIDKDPKFAQAVRRKSRNPDALEALRIRATLHRSGLNTPQSITRPPTPAMSELERLDWNWSNQGSFRRDKKLLETVLDTSDSESVTSIQLVNFPETSEATCSKNLSGNTT